MKLSSITEGGFSHASTSSAHHRADSNRQSGPDRTADPRHRTAGYASSNETSHQAVGRPAASVSTLWGQAAPPGRDGAAGHRHALWARAGAAPTLSLSRVWAALVSGHCVV